MDDFGNSNAITIGSSIASRVWCQEFSWIHPFFWYEFEEFRQGEFLRMVVRDRRTLNSIGGSLCGHYDTHYVHRHNSLPSSSLSPPFAGLAPGTVSLFPFFSLVYHRNGHQGVDGCASEAPR